MNFTVALERFKSAKVDLRDQRTSILFALASSLLVIAWTLVPKTVLPEILTFLLTMFTVLLLPGLWILWAAPDVDNGDWLKRIPLAFTLSYALWSIPIFVIMRLHATWEAFYVLFFILSLLIPLLAVILSRRKTIEGFRLRERLAPGRIIDKIRSSRITLSTVLLIILVLVCAAALIPLSSSGYVDGDVLTHVAMIRNVLESPRFSMEEPLFGAGLPAPTRGAANPWLLLPAFMSRVSGIDPLTLINTYLPPTLGILAILAVYLLVSELSGKKSLALFTTVFFVIYLAAEPFHRHGNQSYILFRRIISDKHFLLAILLPVGIVFAQRYLRSGLTRFLLLFGLTGMGIAFTHSLVTLFLLISTSVFATGYLLVDWINQQAFIKKNAWRVAALVVSAGVLMTIPLLQSRKESDRISYLFLNDLSKISLVSDKTLISPVTSVNSLSVPGQKVPYLGEVEVENANPYLVRRLYGQLKAKGLLVLSSTMFMSHPDLLWDLGTILALCLTPFLLLWVRKDNLALYLFAVTITYPLINFNPFVAPLASRFVTPWLLYRFTWPLPLVLTLAYFLYKFAEWFEKPFSRLQPRKMSLAGLPAVVLLLLMAIWLKGDIQEFVESLMDKRNPTQIFSNELIDFIRDRVSSESHPGSKGDVLLSDYSSNLIFAAFFDHPNLVAHRYNTTSEEFIASRQDEALQRSLDVDYFTEANWLDNRIMEIIRNHEVSHVLVRSNRTLNCQLSFYPSAFNVLYRDQAYTLYEVKPPVQDDPTIQANSWLLEGNLESAFSAYQEGLRREPTSLPALLGISEVYTRNGEPSLALDYLLQAAKTSAEDSCVLKALASGYFNSGDLDKAAESYRKAIAAAPWDEKLYRTLGDVRLLQDRFDEAREAYSQSIQVQLDTDPFSFKEIHTTQQTKTGLPANSPGATSEEIIPRIPSYQDAVSEFFRTRGLSEVEEDATTASLQTDNSQVPGLAANKTDQENTINERPYGLSFYQAGNFYLSREKFDQALASYQNAIQSALLNLDWGVDERVAVGLAYKEMGSLDKAIETFQEIPNYINSVTEPYLELARIYQDQGDLQVALQLYDQAIQIYPDDIRAFLGKSEIYLEQGNEVLALEEYEKALEANPRSSMAWNAIGELYIKQGKLEQARQAFFTSLELTPINEPAYLGLATVYQQESRIDAMLASTRNAIISAPNYSNAYIFLGDALRAQKRIDQAAAAYKRAIELNPIEAAAYSKLVSLRPSPQLAADIEAQLNSFSFRSEPSGSVWSVLANAYGQQADFEQAKTFYQRAIQTDPTLTQAFIGLGELDLIMSNDRASALKHYQQAVQSDPESIRAYSEVANFYLAQGQLVPALAAYQDLVADFPNQAAGYLGLNNVYRRMGNLSQALEILRQAVESNPISAEIHMAYADQLLQNGDLNSAGEMYTQGLQIDPGVVNSLAVIERITRVLGDRQQVRELIDRSGSSAGLSDGAKVALALLDESEGNFESAERLLVEVKDGDTLNPANILQLGEFYQRRQRWEEANQLFNQALALAPFDGTISLEIASTYSNMKRFSEAEDWYHKAQILDASDPSAAIGLAEVNKTRGNWDAALAILEQAADTAPSDALVHMALGDLYRKTGRLSDAEQEFNTACDLDQSQLSCFISLGALYETTQRWQDALEIYTKITDNAPYEASGYVNLARIYQQTGQNERAEEILDRGLDNSLDKEYILVNRAQLYAIQRLWEQARSDLETASQGDSDSVFSEIRLAQFLIQRGQMDEALAMLQTIDRYAEAGPASKVALGDYYAKQADWEKATSFYQAALDLDPAFTEAAISLAYVQRVLGIPEQAEQIYQSMVQLSPDNPELYLAIGDFELNRGNVSEAGEAYQKALELAPNIVATYWRIEKIAQILGNSDSKLKILEDLVKKEPTPDLFIELGQFYQAEGKWEQAFSLYQHSAARYPKHGDTWLAIGNYYQYFGDWEKALEAYDTAIQLYPASYLAWQSKGSILQSLGRMDEALESYDVAIDLDRSQVSGYIAKANLLNETEQKEYAIATLNQAIQANPTSTEGYLYLSQLYSENNETQQALEGLQQGITLLPGSAEMHAARGEILQHLAFDLKEKLDASRANDLNAEEFQEFQTANKAELQRIQLFLDEAGIAYDQALEIQPINATALIGQGQIAALANDHQKALEYLSRASRFNPLMDKVWISIGEYFLQIKDWQEAYDAFFRAMQLSPSNPRARFGLSEAMAGFELTDSSTAAFSIQNSLYLWDRIINRSGRTPTRTGRIQ